MHTLCPPLSLSAVVPSVEAFQKKVLDELYRTNRFVACWTAPSLDQRSSKALHNQLEQIGREGQHRTSQLEQIEQNCEHTAHTSQQAHTQLLESETTLQNMTRSIQQLTDQIGSASQGITQLAENSQSIGAVVDMITTITSQIIVIIRE